MKPEPVRIPLSSGRQVSGLLLEPVRAEACFVLAHGAGAGMSHRFMEALAASLFEHGIATLRFQFPFIESGSKRPDPPAIAQEAVRAAVEAVARLLPALPVFAGGKSFGGRMSSQAAALGLLPQIRGLAFVGFPLHPAGKPGVERAGHLAEVDVPLLFLQGTRDALAEIGLVRELVRGLHGLASLHIVDEADHSFHVLARSGRSDAEVVEDLAGELSAWMAAVVADGDRRR